MKTCTICKKEKELDQFNFKNKSRGWLSSYCRECQNRMSADHYRNNKAQYIANNKAGRTRNVKKMVEYLSAHPCVDCGEADPIVLEFDHLRDKSGCISKMVRFNSWRVIIREISKCVVRCANCHRRKTASTCGWIYKMPPCR